METVGACASAAVLGAGKDPGGYTPLHKPFWHVPPQSRRVNAPLWSENGYRLCPFWSGIGYGFRGSYGRVWTHRFNSNRVRKKEKYANSKLILRNFFGCCPWWRNFLKVMSENGCEKLHFFGTNRVRIWTTERHTRSTNSQEYPRGAKRSTFLLGGWLSFLIQLAPY